jgi:hypothetical protein
MKYNYDKERQKSGTNKHIPQSKLKIPISYNFFFSPTHSHVLHPIPQSIS